MYEIIHLIGKYIIKFFVHIFKQTCHTEESYCTMFCKVKKSCKTL